MKALALTLLVTFTAAVGADTNISTQIQSEFARLYAKVNALEPESELAFFKVKSYGDYELLWRVADEPGEYDVIRIFRDKGERGKYFEIAYYRADHIVEGRTVIRRRVGPALSAWRNDTIDADTGEYLGRQGAKFPELDERDRQIMQDWAIELPE